MTKLFKVAIVSLAVLGAATSANAMSPTFSVDTVIQEHALNGE